MAGVSTKEIKNRIRSMENTKQITKAMEMVAASKLRRAQAQVMTARPYFETIHATIRDIAANSQGIPLPYLEPARGDGKIAYVVIAGDRGLAGGYNSSILKACMEDMKGLNTEIMPIGRRTVEFFQARGIPLIAEKYADAEHVSVSDCFSIAKLLCRSFRKGQYSEIRIGYTNCISVLTQRPAVMKLLPLDHVTAGTGMEGQDIIYEPRASEVFEAIIPEYIGGVIYGALCESRASEQAARRTAMDTATQNAEDMIADLSLKYNQARQAAITQEITEIVAGV